MLRSSGLALAFLALLTACSQDASEAERGTNSEAAVQEVRSVNETPPPIEEIVPEPLEPAEIEANDLVGMACSFAPGTNGSVRLIAREADAVMKLDGELVRFAADPGSRKLPANTRTLYNGTEYALRLAIEDTAEVGEGGAKGFEGTMWLYDRWDRVVYTGTGTASCGV